MDKRILIGLLVVGAAAAAYYFLVGKASAEELYVQNLSDADLNGLVAAGMNGTAYANLSATDVQKLYPAARAEQARRASGGQSTTAAQPSAAAASQAVAFRRASGAVQSSIGRGAGLVIDMSNIKKP